MSTRLPAVIEKLASRVLLSAGDPDPAFGAGQLVETQFPGGASVISDIETLPDGSILAAGHLQVVQGDQLTGEFKLLVARYRFDGSLDESFGAGGMIINTPRGMSSGIQIASTSDGGFVVLGASRTPGDGFTLFTPGLLLKFSKSGKLDRSFGNNALVKTPFGSYVAIDSQGRLLVGGSRDHPGVPQSSVGMDAVLQRFTASGVLDTTFNNTGEFVDPIGAIGEEDSQIKMFRSIAFDRQGRIIAGVDFFSTFGGDETTDGLGFQNERLFRFSDDGVVDPDYGQVNIVGQLRHVERVLDDGSVMLVGKTIAKVDPTGKQLDASYGIAGVANTTKVGPFPGDFHVRTMEQAAISPDGSMIFANVADAGTLELTRLTAQGHIDISFGTAGTKEIAHNTHPDATDTLGAVELAPDGTVVFAGQTGHLTPPSAAENDFNQHPTVTVTADTRRAVIGRALGAQGPAVQLVPRTLATPSRSLYVSVLIRDTEGVELATLDDADLKLIDSTDGIRRFRFVASQDVNGDGTYILARYRISAPDGGGWTSANNGVYQVRLARKQIADNDGDYAMAQALGPVVVKIV